ncbi:hypothetical protein CHH38_18935 [Acinetobacter nosocomialis]|uniref:hypothetical protein n=1 Tax=Acinetobacter TaxID=469 RepID=UPI00073D3399|nr:MULTISPECIES: hypothetical protein [Acinetobacter]ALV71926.1 hypothetical protein RZ95_02735 [Acinetobacter johnsonii XBB1]MCV2452721.1 hypothetical protein [Acinetobacter johnsonii]MDH1532439.1 hypothetical protein [Acinetobacter johnsonii]PHM79555.1 hypothetical protein CHH38_18935 [Acinetobacter nosocomialis]SEM02212.1 hypothetical protein SAMN05216500_109109 [Acinetobacter sp. DSM 11652]
MKEEELRKLYTIEVFLKHGDLPKTMRDDWTPSFGLEQGKYGIKDDDKAHAYISLNGKLKKSKCEFFEDKNLAQKFLNHVEPKLKKLYPSITINLRNVKSSELDYRRKKALEEAIANNLKIQKSL